MASETESTILKALAKNKSTKQRIRNDPVSLAKSRWKASHQMSPGQLCSLCHFAFSHGLCVGGVHEVMKLLGVPRVPQDALELVL